jgi:hypothetical protein
MPGGSRQAGVEAEVSLSNYKSEVKSSSMHENAGGTPLVAKQNRGRRIVTPGTRTRDRRGPRRTLTTWTRQPRAEKGSSGVCRNCSAVIKGPTPDRRSDSRYTHAGMSST